ncbi:olfactory receptor 11H1-like, partial [Liasis olivaceus]
WYIVPVFLISRLSFCGSNIIGHFVCDSGQLLALGCHPPAYLPLFCYIVTSSVVLATFLFIVVSYAGIVFTLTKTSRKSSSIKGFPTMSSHLAVVAIFYGSVVAMYIGHNGESHTENTKVMTLFYSSIAPLLNPLIYCLQNDQVKEPLIRLLRKKRVT